MKGGRSDRHMLQAWMVSPESTWLPAAPWKKLMPRQLAERIVCLTEETTETLYCLGEGKRIVGISSYTVRPPQARQEKPLISSFIKADTDAILRLQPDLVLGFSDLQAEIASDLIKHGIEVHVFNQRTIAGIYRMINTLGSLVGCEGQSEALVLQLERGLDQVRRKANQLPFRPRVYFEEWYDPLISGIGWVSELIDIAGGEDCFGGHALEPLAKNRIISNPDEVIHQRPDIMIASWCGKKFEMGHVLARPGWSQIPAIQKKQVYELDSSIILQPGPAALTDGVNQLFEIFAAGTRSGFGANENATTFDNGQSTEM